MCVDRARKSEGCSENKELGSVNITGAKLTNDIWEGEMMAQLEDLCSTPASPKRRLRLTALRIGALKGE